MLFVQVEGYFKGKFTAFVNCAVLLPGIVVEEKFPAGGDCDAGLVPLLVGGTESFSSVFVVDDQVCVDPKSL